MAGHAVGVTAGAGEAAPRQQAAITVDRVVKRYATSNGPVDALDDVAFAVARGEFVSIVGPSGCGKSTLLRIVAGLEPPTSGAVAVDGRPVTGPQTAFGIVFQSPLLLRWRDALGNVMLQAEARRLPREEAEREARRLLESVGLAGSERKRPAELSGGMQQRVAICRALLHNPDVILMDEPFGALDAITRDQMNIDLQRLWRLGEKTVVFVTHSIAEAVFLSDRVIVMSPAPGRVELDLGVDLPRPRRIAMRETAEFNECCNEVRRVFERTGVLREDV